MSDCRFGVSPVNYPDPEEARDLFVNSFTFFNQRHGTSCFYPPCVCPAGPTTFHSRIPVLLLEEDPSTGKRRTVVICPCCNSVKKSVINSMAMLIKRCDKLKVVCRTMYLHLNFLFVFFVVFASLFS